MWQNGDEEKAMNGYVDIVKETMLDTATEKLFLGRLYEGLSKGYDESNDKTSYDFYNNALFERFPQLMPFNSLKAKMHLSTAGVNDANTEKVLDELKKCNIEWVDNADQNTPEATISFIKKGDKYEATVNVKSGMNKPVVLNEKMIFKNTDGAGKELALRLFGKGGAMVYEKENKG